MRKSALGLLLALLIVFSLVLGTTMRFSGAQTSGTNVNGVITQDTIWTQANSPYVLTAPVLVNYGVTLTIEPGVTVYLNDTYLEVNGTLCARGTNTNKIELICNGSSLGFLGGSIPAIQFTSYSANWNEQTDSGSIIENAIVSSTQESSTIQIDNSPKINKCTVINTGGQRAIWIGLGSPIISNNTITSNFAGITVAGNQNPSILNNTIKDCGVGIEVYSGAPLIEKNLIVNNTGNLLGGEGGIRINYVGTSPCIEYNTIAYNSAGLNLLSSPNPTIENNNIFGNFNYNIYLYAGSNPSTNDINATYNWWGTTDAQAINQTIYDFKDDFNLGNVSFVPFLALPNAQAPTYINATGTAGGSIAPSGIISLSYNGSQAFTITPDTGYYIADVLVNGTSVGAVSSYTVQNVNGATTIEATFAPNPTSTPSPTASPTPPPSTTSTPTSSSTPATSPTASPSSSPTVPEIPSVIIILAVILTASIATIYLHKKNACPNNS